MNIVLLFDLPHQSLLFALILLNRLFQSGDFPLDSSYFLIMHVLLSVLISFEFNCELIESHMFLLQPANLTLLVRHLQSHHQLLICSLFLLPFQFRLKGFSLFYERCHALCCLLAIRSDILKLLSQILVLQGELLHFLQQLFDQRSILRGSTPITSFPQYLLHNLNYKPPSEPVKPPKRRYPKSILNRLIVSSPN